MGIAPFRVPPEGRLSILRGLPPMPTNRDSARNGRDRAVGAQTGGDMGRHSRNQQNALYGLLWRFLPLPFEKCLWNFWNPFVSGVQNEKRRPTKPFPTAYRPRANAGYALVPARLICIPRLLRIATTPRRPFQPIATMPTNPASQTASQPAHALRGGQRHGASRGKGSIAIHSSPAAPRLSQAIAIPLIFHYAISRQAIRANIQ